MNHRDNYWSSIKNDYRQTEDEFNKDTEGDIIDMIHIDAWQTDDDDDEGETIAKVIKTKSGDVCVIYQNGIARWNKKAQEIIQESIAELRGLA